MAILGLHTHTDPVAMFCINFGYRKVTKFQPHFNSDLHYSDITGEDIFGDAYTAI